MSDFVCKKCDAEFTTGEFPFGDDVTCPHCGTVFETDWDYVDEDSMAAWLVREKPPPAPRTP